MHDTLRRRPANSLVTLLTLAMTFPFAAVQADEKNASDASAHILQAEIALQRDEYLKATTEYRKAAELSESVELARKATRMGFSYGFNDEALLAAIRWQELDSESEEARAFLGQLYFRVNDLRNARRQFEKLIKAGPEDPGTRLLSLVSYLSEEDMPERADELIRTLAKPYKDSARAHYAVAVMALRSGDSEYARQRAKEAIEIDPDFTRPRLLYARALMFEGDSDKAIEYLAHLIGDSPQPDPDARMELALMYMLTGRDDDALSQVNQVLLEESGRLDALRLMAIINFRLERLDAAWDDFQDLLASGQYRMDALFYLGRIADYREQYERAVRLYREVRFGSNTMFAQRRASALLAHQLDDVDGAFRMLEDFAAASPDNAVDVVTLKAQLLVSLERYEEALELYDKAIEYRPDSESLVLGRCDLLLRTGRLDDAIAEYRRALKRWPDSALTLNALGYTLADRTDQYAEAEKLIRKALKLDPENPAIIDSYGWVLYKLGKLEAGLQQLNIAYERFSDHEVAAHIVEVLAELGRKDEAFAMLESAEAKTPDSKLLQDVRARYFDDKP
ncbi:MAG TPA: tetratricopeptide repeat protein [Woeseiaceae bacterium]|nr:tetratricopeptide repeat protein [Woeseiaceae bacterium]